VSVKFKLYSRVRRRHHFITHMANNWSIWSRLKMESSWQKPNFKLNKLHRWEAGWQKLLLAMLYKHNLYKNMLIWNFQIWSVPCCVILDMAASTFVSYSLVLGFVQQATWKTVGRHGGTWAWKSHTADSPVSICTDISQHLHSQWNETK